MLSATRRMRWLLGSCVAALAACSNAPRECFDSAANCLSEEGCVYQDVNGMRTAICAPLCDLSSDAGCPLYEGTCTRAGGDCHCSRCDCADQDVCL